MSHHVSTGAFTVSKWEENPYQEIEGAAKLNMAEIEQAYSGGLIGRSEIRYLMLYPGEGITTTSPAWSTSPVCSTATTGASVSAGTARTTAPSSRDRAPAPSPV